MVALDVMSDSTEVAIDERAFDEKSWTHVCLYMYIATTTDHQILHLCILHKFSVALASVNPEIRLLVASRK